MAGRGRRKAGLGEGDDGGTEELEKDRAVGGVGGVASCTEAASELVVDLRK